MSEESERNDKRISIFRAMKKDLYDEKLDSFLSGYFLGILSGILLGVVIGFYFM